MSDTVFLEPFTSFMAVPRAANPARLDADVAVFGFPLVTPYDIRGASLDSARMPGSVREQSIWLGDPADRHDFDFGGTIYDGKDVRVVDCGDVRCDPTDLPAARARATSVTRSILESGAVPVMLGGDDSAPIPFFRAFEGRGPFTLVQIDAHIDWRNDVNGIEEGYSSTMRRASELSCIERIVQVGQRGTGSARSQEVRDALAYGVKFVSAREIHESGVGAALKQVPEGGEIIVTIDCDGIDPSIMPGVNAPSPGGLFHHHAVSLLQGLANKGRIAGLSIVELAPVKDINGISAYTAARLIINIVGSMVRTGQIPRKR
jgi:agmatinase